MAFYSPLIVHILTSLPLTSLCKVSYNVVPGNFDLALKSKGENVMAEAYIWQCESGTCSDHLVTSICRDFVVAAGSSATRVP